jgi:hypothetical protein
VKAAVLWGRTPILPLDEAGLESCSTSTLFATGAALRFLPFRDVSASAPQLQRPFRV